MNVEDYLTDKHIGEDVWIIGNGPSLRFLRARDIGPGPVITLNDAISVIQVLRVPNPIYSMQGDYNSSEHSDLWPSLKITTETLLVRNDCSALSWQLDYKPRYVYYRQFHPYDDYSARSAVKVGLLFGCKNINLVCFDACTHGDCGRYSMTTGVVGSSAYTREFLPLQCFRMQRPLPGMLHRWITPKAEGHPEITVEDSENLAKIAIAPAHHPHPGPPRLRVIHSSRDKLAIRRKQRGTMN